MVEEGDRVPAQVLDALAAQELGSAAAGSANVTFAVTEGGASLASAGQTVGTGGGPVAHPEIVAGQLHDESYIQMLVDGQPRGRTWRIGTIAGGSVDHLLSKDVPASSEALLTRGADYAAVDTGLLRSETPPDTTEPATDQYCTTILDKERNIYRSSRVLARGCSDQSQEDALAQAQSKALDSGASVENLAYLVTFYEHAGYGGKWADVIGCCGTCDPSGYIFATRDVGPDTFWKYNLSSLYRKYPTNCTRVRYQSNRAANDWSGDRYLNDWYVGDHLNDRIITVKIW